jgi:hypothetical protein
MAKTYKALQTVVVGAGGAASINFTNIPQNYDDLIIKHSLRSNHAQIYEYCGVRFNSNSSSIYSLKNLRGNGSTVISQTLTNQTRFEFEMAEGNTATSNTFSNGEFYIPNYRGSANKSVSSESVQETNATLAYSAMDAGIWASTAAITDIQIFPTVGTLWNQYSMATLYGVGGARATGGTITADGLYTYHTFTSSGAFIPLENIEGIDYLVVAGGGGGAGWYGGGGGAGGLRSSRVRTGGGGSVQNQINAIAGTTYSVTVGSGGASQTNGNNSIFANVMSTGGGRGGSYQSNAPGGNGGSGGGGGAGNAVGGVWLPGGTGTANEGYGGGTGHASNAGAPGGGGAGAAASNAPASPNGTATDGGIGVELAVFANPTGTGSNNYYAGGGGGGSTVGGGNGVYAGVGGLGGGGAGSLVANSGTGVAGTANTGGGGGGSAYNVNSGGAGGSGIVIVRYPNT